MPSHIIPSLVDQVYERILDEICDGTLQPNSRLIQDDLAEVYDVSRQPVQQAIMLLRERGFVTDAPKRGVVVAPLDVDLMRSIYQVREVLEGLACRLAAERATGSAVQERGRELIARGRAAIAHDTIANQIAADIAFHEYVSELSENSVIGEMSRPQLHHMRRTMGEVLRLEESVTLGLWDEHEEILGAIVAQDAARAEALGRAHVVRAREKFVARLEELGAIARAAERRRALTRIAR
ncbi:GntR family transcriptional regulator [Methylobacterium sp. NFXW15]|uniref:GntR family transcriptional regulator n=1 Tax=Methylobacterium sp. NFXW15 TaxID=2819512 RepID=UPI003CE686A5